MARCPSCEYPLPDNRERVGRGVRIAAIRCTSLPAVIRARPAAARRPVALHPANESIGPCSRCGNYLCEVCRSRWRDQVLCPACVERAIAANEATPQQARAQLRQAMVSLFCGAGAWVMSLLAVMLAAYIVSEGEPSVVVLSVLGFVMLGAVVPAVFGIGQAVTVLRARGHHMILATIGLMLSGLYVGVMIGALVLNFWQT